MDNFDKYEILILLANGEIAKAIDVILYIIVKGKDTELRNEIIMISSEFKRVEKASRQGKIRWEDENNAKKQITLRILDLFP
ncbi:MAG: hypothetical protein H6557_26775 [Lewinellaceae bacterium]|nr:hypothetical protein [Phaeodactylibacter sp.]MCB9040245.1 hypothetical protein [Lewinellaceae bacterium]